MCIIGVNMMGDNVLYKRTSVVLYKEHIKSADISVQTYSIYNKTCCKISQEGIIRWNVRISKTIDDIMYA